MTLQEIYDMAVSGVLKQGCRSIDSDGSRLLRAPDGSACAVGYLISDEDYLPKLEVEGWMSGYDDSDHLSESPIAKVLSKKIGEITPSKLDLLQRLQDAHDDSLDFNSVPDAFKQVASDCALSSKIVTNWENSQ